MYRLLAEHGHRLFGDEYLADLFAANRKGRPSVPARVVATVMLLESLEGLSDREAKVPPARNSRGGFTKDDVRIDTDLRLTTTQATHAGPRIPRARSGEG